METNYLGFLESSEIKLDVAYPSPDDFERISELVQRTNQLNFSGRKYTRDEVGEILGDENLEKLVLRCRDKYGSYGTIGFAIIRHCFDEIRVEDLMLSCRVQGKFIEQGFFSHLPGAPQSTFNKPALGQLYGNGKKHPGKKNFGVTSLSTLRARERD